MIDKTLSEATIRRSIRKFFVDNLHNDDHPVSFEVDFKEPVTSTGDQANRWINIHFGSPRYTGNSARYRFDIYLLIRGDNDGQGMAELRDEVVELLVDYDKSDGDRRLPLYDANFTQVSSAIMRLELESDDLVAEDFTIYRFLSVELHYAIK